ncbi:MAG: hypothetical protein K6F59_01800 [Gammaproteobacteria bacterium]|nr:hypothetical protein [Gammaproteobacteria bacterium]
MRKFSVTSFLVRIFTILIIGVSASFAWFSNYDAARIGDGSDLKVDIDPFNSVSLNIKEIPVSDFTFRDECISGDGRNFYQVVTSEYGRVISGYQTLQRTSQVYAQRVFDYTFDFYAYGSLSLYLGPESWVKPHYQTLEGEELDNYPEYQKNRDRIAGAVRIALIRLDANDQEVSTVTWIPNSTYEYNASTGIVNENGNVESQYTYVRNTNGDLAVFNVPLNPDGEHAGEPSASGSDNVNGFIWGDLPDADNIGKNIPIFTTSVLHGARTKVRVTCRIWIEGTDREAMANLMGGRFDVYFHFIIVNKDE